MARLDYVTHADLGGQCLAAVIVSEPDERPHLESWEARTLALTLAMGATGAWNIDMSRSARETLADYAQLSYYQVWFAGLCRLLQQRGLVLAEEIRSGQVQCPPRAVPKVLRAPEVAAVLARGAPTTRGSRTAARFAVGDRVCTRTGVPTHHTRLPGYARGKQGIIERAHGAHVFADTNAQELGEQPQWLYTVVFDERELWGESAQPQGLRVSIDAWEPYLEPAA
jgi:nitrile hydratase